MVGRLHLHGTVRSRLRILLYSHDTMGLGHIRRNQTIAQSLAEHLDDPSILVVSGARQSTWFDVPRNVEFVTVPSIRKAGGGLYEARSLNVSSDDVFRMRRDILLSTVRSFEPNIVIIDKVPRGVANELVPALEYLRGREDARCVLGLRDILDTPEVAEQEWIRDEIDSAIDRYFDSVWIYGDRRIHDYTLDTHIAPSTRDKIRYAGYLDRARRNVSDQIAFELLSELGLSADRRLFLCLVGGGEDGSELAQAFLQAKLPADGVGLIVAGPYMPREVQVKLEEAVTTRTDLRVVPFVKNIEAIMSHADRVISMGGYNTVCEILAYGKTALIVPRVEPREEQLVRAAKMEHMGLLEMLHPAQLTAAAISEWLAAPRCVQADLRNRIQLNGLDQLPRLLAELLTSSRTILPVAASVQSLSTTGPHWSLTERTTGVIR